jgi:uncharacterized protein (TIGR03435 family)
VIATRASALGFLSILTACRVLAQQAGPSFEAASVKLNHSASTGMGGMIGIGRGGTISMRNVTARTLIEIAYEWPDYALTGPGWISSAGYDVEAKPAQPVDQETGRLMLQNLLAERFNLLVHHENAAINGFNLVVDRGGSKLKPSQAPGIGFSLMGPDEIRGPGDMRMLVWVLKGILTAPVADHTGIDGKFDVELKWTRDAVPASGSAPMASEPVLSIFAAIRQQLGLSLEATKVPVDRMVIDRLERPTEN